MARRCAAVVILAVLAAAPAWGQTCAPTLVSIGTDEPFEVQSARFDTTGGSSESSYLISFDLAAGTLETRMDGNGFGRTQLEAADRFRIDGLAGTALIDAVLEVTAVRMNGCGLQCAWAMTRVEWRDEAGGRVDHLADTRQFGVYHFEMTLPVLVSFGQPFTLFTVIETQVQGLGANLFGRADVSTRLRFDGVPAGARITSCHGFDSAPNTPVAHSSWGRVKALYR